MASVNGAHMILYSANADADRAFVRDVLGFPHVDVGHGWLIFALPASELAVHPAETGAHEIYLMVDDVAAFVARIQERGVRCTAPQDRGWGVLTQLTLPGGGQLGIYEPRHTRPSWPASPNRKAVKPRKSVAKRRAVATAVKPARRARRRTKR